MGAEGEEEEKGEDAATGRARRRDHEDGSEGRDTEEQESPKRGPRPPRQPLRWAEVPAVRAVFPSFTDQFPALEGPSTSRSGGRGGSSRRETRTERAWTPEREAAQRSGGVSWRKHPASFTGLEVRG